MQPLHRRVHRAIGVCVDEPRSDIREVRGPGQHDNDGVIRSTWSPGGVYDGVIRSTWSPGGATTYYQFTDKFFNDGRGEADNFCDGPRETLASCTWPSGFHEARRTSSGRSEGSCCEPSGHSGAEGLGSEGGRCEPSGHSGTDGLPIRYYRSFHGSGPLFPAFRKW